MELTAATSPRPGLLKLHRTVLPYNFGIFSLKEKTELVEYRLRFCGGEHDVVHIHPYYLSMLYTMERN